jgi:hypothetical protein
MSDNIIVATDDNFAASLFQPDTLISLQYSENFRRKTPLESEKKLMLAILADVVWCFQASVWARNGKGEKLFGEAEEWILDESSDWVFSFESICEVLAFSPWYIRQGLLLWKEKRLIRRRNFQARENIMKEPQGRTA